MDSRNNSKRKKDKYDEDDYNRDKRYKRPRSKSRSPAKRRDKQSERKRRHSKSRSPDRRIKQEREKENNPSKGPETKLPERKAKDTDMLNTRTGGAYIPPARLRMMQAQITDKSSVAYQRLAWEALKKSIHGHINKINVGNIGIIIKELLKENIVRGRGLLCRSVIQAQAASPTFTNVYAALVAAVNSRFPNIGELLLKRLVIQFKRGFKRNDKSICISSASFIAHLVNQRVAHEILALELLTLLVETPSDDSVEVAIAFLKECGQKLTEVSSKGVNAIFEMLRNILHEGQLDKRVQYMIEVMFQVWKDGFKDHPALIEELELVPEEEQFTHLLMLDDATDPQDILNVFKFDDKYEESEQKYKTLSKEILGSDAESGEEDGSDESGSEESEEEEEGDGQKGGVTIIDNTETNLVALRRTIYLTINSSLDFEECAHKLLKMQLKPGQEVELCHMFLDCCAEQRTYEKFYGLLAQRFCNINRIYIGPFEEIFKDSYGTAHRLDTNRLRNVSKFFAHLLFTDSISWEVLECVKLNEEDTTSSSRIYIKILFQELAEYMGLKKLNDRLKDPTLQEAFSGIFPRDNPKNTRFSINFFTSIGLGGLTDELREHLKQMPKNVPAPVQEILVDSESDSSSSSNSSSTDSSSDSSSSDSETESNKKKEKKKKSIENPTMALQETTEKVGERWGHSGFYDTYGKDARRLEKSDNHERDNFVAPRDVPNRRDRVTGRYKEREYEERDIGNRRRHDKRNDLNEERNSGDKRRQEDTNDDQEIRSRNRDERIGRRLENEKDRRYSEKTNEDKYYRKSDKEIRGEKDIVENEYRSRNKSKKDDRKQVDREGRGRNAVEEIDSKNKSKSQDTRQAVENRSNQKSNKDARRNKEKQDDSTDDENRHKIEKQSKAYTDSSSSKDRTKNQTDEYPSEEEPSKRKQNKNEKDVTRSYRDKSYNSDDDDRDDKKRKKSKKKKSSNDATKKGDEKRYYENETIDEKKYRKDIGKKHKNKDQDDDGWDIRARSIRRDLGERYWDKK